MDRSDRTRTASCSATTAGFQISYDAGRTFDILNNIPFTQFYNVAYDLQTPYHLCGGLQDNGSWCGPSQTPGTPGTPKSEWQNVGGGDGFFAVPDLKTPELVYNNLQGGVISLTNRKTGASWGINPYPGGIGSSGQWMAPQKYRFNWNAPIVLSPQDPKTVYYGGNVLFRTTNYGHSWDGHQPGPDDQRQGQAAVVGRQDRHRQHRRRVPLHDHLDRAVAGGPERHLGGHRRRQRAGDA